MKTDIYPIRLIVGIGNNLVQGFAVVFERPDGTVGSRNVWFDNETFSKLKFTDSASRIIFVTDDNVKVPEQELGFFQKFFGSGWEYVDPHPVLKEILINRGFVTS